MPATRAAAAAAQKAGRKTSKELFGHAPRPADHGEQSERRTARVLSLLSGGSSRVGKIGSDGAVRPASVFAAVDKFKKLGKEKEQNANRVEKWLELQAKKQQSCKSLPFTILFYVSFTLSVFGHRDVDVVFPLLDIIDVTVQTGTVPQSLPEHAEPTISSTLDAVGSWADSLVWVERTLVPLLWKGGDGGSGAVIGVNRLVGGARLRQKRLKRASCPGPESLADSYGTWLRSTYNQSCVSDSGELESARLTSLPGATPGLETLQQGLEADEDGWYTYWMDVGLQQPEARAVVAQVRDARWLSTESQNLEIQTMLYSGQVARFVILEIEFAMDRVGAFKKTLKTKSLPSSVFTKTWAYVVDGVFVLLLFWLFMGEIFSAVNEYRKDGWAGLKNQFLQFQRLTNFFCIVVGVGFIFFFTVLAKQLIDLSETVAEIIKTSDAGGQTPMLMRQKLAESYDDAAQMAADYRMQEFMAFGYTCMMLAKFFDGFRGNQRMAILTDTLAVAADDLFHFFIILAIVFFNFILGAYLLFGQVLREWSSLRRAANSGFRALMGDFDFEVMYKIAPISATFWFWGYMILVTLILINILLAIVLEGYTEVKEKAGKSNESLLHQLGGMLRSLKEWGKRKGGSTGSTTGIVNMPPEEEASTQELLMTELKTLRQEMKLVLREVKELKEAKAKATSTEHIPMVPTARTPQQPAKGSSNPEIEPHSPGLRITALHTGELQDSPQTMQEPRQAALAQPSGPLAQTVKAAMKGASVQGQANAREVAALPDGSAVVKQRAAFLDQEAAAIFGSANGSPTPASRGRSPATDGGRPKHTHKQAAPPANEAVLRKLMQPPGKPAWPSSDHAAATS